MENIFETQMNKNTVFLNKDIISSHYTPEKLPFREKQINDITQGLGAVTNNAKPNNLFVYGKTGCIAGDSLVYTSNGWKKIKNVDALSDLVLTFNKETKRYEWSEFVFLKFENKDPLLKVTLQNGYELVVTKDHPLLKSTMEWCKANELLAGDELALAHNLPSLNEHEMPLALARLLGFTLSDGSLNRRQRRTKDGRGNYYNSDRQRFRYFSIDNALLSKVQSDVRNLFGGTPSIIYPKDRCSHVNIISQEVCQVLNSLGVPFGEKSGIIEVPESVLEASPQIQKEFLKALFSGDGTVSQQTYQIEYYSNSRKFLQQVACLLYQEGIECKVKYKPAKLNGVTYDAHRLYIQGQGNIMKYYYKIGFYSIAKQEKLEKMIAKYVKNMPVNEKGYALSPIAKIEETFEEFVYDLTVPKNHSFIANGIISHNTGKTSTVKHVLEQLGEFVKKRELSVGSAYINCRSHSSKYKVLLKAIRGFYPEKDFLGYSASFVYEKLLEYAIEKKAHLILVLDEIDKVKDIDDLVYSLSRGNDELHGAGSVTLIGISNNLTFKEKLDPRTKSSLCEREMVFDPYNANELKEILHERCAVAFKEKAVSDSAIALAAAIAAQESGDARTAVMLMQRAGEIADSEEVTIVSDKHVEKAKASVEEEIIISMISTLPQQQQMVLYAISQLTTQKKGLRKVNGEIEEGVLYSGEIFESYLELAKKFGEHTITSRWYRQYINELEMYGLIFVTSSGKGIKGQTRLIKLGFDAMKIKSALEKELFKQMN
ncbi:MAG: LAGLIDADG family homing endonuclease [archaeon]